MTVNIDKELFPENTGGAVPTYDVDGNIESVEKLDGELTYRTGFTTQEGFKKALKDLGQDVSYAATPETLRAAFTEINGGGFEEPEDTEKVTFGVINGIVGELVNEEAGEPTISVKSATKMDVSGATPEDNPGIVENGDKYTVTKSGNTITVTDEGLIPYVGGNVDEPKKWVGILVDLGVKAQGVEYNIEDIDYSDAARWGATNDTTFIMWLYTEKGGNYTFKNVDNEEDTVEITIVFE